MACLMILAVHVSVLADDTVELFTEQAAGELNLDKMKGEKWDQYLDEYIIRAHKGLSFGPVIKVKYPEVIDAPSGPTIQLTSPTDLFIEFLPLENGKPVDMKTLEVVGKKGFFSRSLTDKLKPFVRENRLEAKKVKIPAGKFHFQVSIADTDGAETTKNFVVTVK